MIKEKCESPLQITRESPVVYEEDDLLPVSALAQLVYCERRCALIFTERVWDENRYTAEGKILHERVDKGGSFSRAALRTAYNVDIRSRRLGLVGKADVVEFHSSGADSENGAEAEHAPRDQTLDALFAELDAGGNGVEPPAGTTREDACVPFPVEYKRGRLKIQLCYEVQLCAQGLCLEEMLDVPVPAGALYYGASRRRKVVTFSAELRARTEDAALRLHRLIQSSITPKARYSKKCDQCSLLDLCMPKSMRRAKSVAGYLQKVLRCDAEPV